MQCVLVRLLLHLSVAKALPLTPADSGVAMSAGTALTAVDRDDSGVLLVEEQRFSILPEWVLDLEVSDAAIRLYAVLLRYGGSSGSRMPSRRTLAERLHRSVDSIDRAMRELESAHVVRVERRRHGLENLTNRYHLRTSDPAIPAVPAREGGRRSAATPGRTVAVTLAADLRPDPEVPTETPPPRTPSRRPGASPAQEGVDGNAALLAACGITDLQALAQRCAEARQCLGLPDARWAGPCLLVAIHVAVIGRHWPPALVEPALIAIAGDPNTRSPMRLAEAGPWWDHSPGSVPHDEVDVGLVEFEERLAATDGRRVALQAQARNELRSEGQPVTRLTVARQACEILDRPVTV